VSSFEFNSPRRGVTPEDSVDVRRYLSAISRSRRMILAMLVIVTGTVVAVSLWLPDSYRATTSIVLDDDTSALAPSDPESVRRQLNTIQQLLTSSSVLKNAAARLPGETADSLEDKVGSEVDPEANIVDVSASDENPRRAAEIANTVADTFLTERARLERRRIAETREELEAELARLEADPAGGAQVDALRQRLSQLSVSELSAGSDLQVVSEAETPTAPNSPRPLRNGVLAAFAALFLGVLLALGRDQLTPRVHGPREVGRLLDVRVLAGVPYLRGFRRRARLMSGVEAEAYETLRAAVEVAVPPEGGSTILVSGAVHGEGKTTVTWRLGNGLARAGHRTLLVSADLRVPRLHLLADTDSRLGLGDLLMAMDLEGQELEPALFEQAIHEARPATSGLRRQGCLHVIASGSELKDPGSLVSGPAMTMFLGQVKELDYDYVLVDAPPLLGIADSQVMARQVDQIMLVSRLDRVTLDHLADLREVLEEIDRPVLGVVVIGARGEGSPYYARRAPLIRSEADASS
jgi:Mrp family chromosome partitioning ATPase/capsular polysaccharide biosynthesis protein